MRFLADESCDFALVRALQGAGHDVASIARITPGADDALVIELALRDTRILLTEDKDFGQLVFAAGAASVGVILIRFPAGRRTSMVEAVTTLVATHADQVSSRFVVVEPGRIRISGQPKRRSP